MHRLNRHIAKGFSQIYGIYYLETFSLITRLNSIRILSSLTINLEWLMFQLDVKNAFLYGDLHKGSLYGLTSRILLLRRKIWLANLKSHYELKTKFSSLVSEDPYSNCWYWVLDMSLWSLRICLICNFCDCSSPFMWTIFLLTKSDTIVLTKTKNYLKQFFATKDMRKPRYFFGMWTSGVKIVKYI